AGGAVCPRLKREMQADLLAVAVLRSVAREARFVAPTVSGATGDRRRVDEEVRAAELSGAAGHIGSVQAAGELPWRAVVRRVDRHAAAAAAAAGAAAASAASAATAATGTASAAARAT